MGKNDFIQISLYYKKNTSYTFDLRVMFTKGKAWGNSRTTARTVAVRRNVTFWINIDVSDASDGSDRKLQYCSDKKGCSFYPNCP